MEHKIAEPNARVDVADVLRGLAVMGIILLHSIEHFNFYSFPEKVPFEWMNFTDQAIWRGLFFTFSNKAYAVFALLFGLVFIFRIIINNAKERTSGSVSYGGYLSFLSSDSSMLLSLPEKY